MEVDAALAFNTISSMMGEKLNFTQLEKAGKVLAVHAEENGLTEKQLQSLVGVICSEKCSGGYLLQLLRCLIPETYMPDDVLGKILAWVFTKIGQLAPSVERLVFRWIADLLKFNLCTKDVVQKYYYNFLFALIERKHLEVNACIVLCYISQQHDAKPFIINPLIDRYKRGAFSQLKSLLATLKGLREEAVPITLGNCPLHRTHSSFDVGMANAEDRATNGARLARRKSRLTFRPSKTEWAKKPRLIPATEYARHRDSFNMNCKPVVGSPSLAVLAVTAPAQIMSLLANEGGFLNLLSADPSQQVRLLYNLEETLNKVLLLESESYSDKEKAFLLVAMAALQEYFNYGLPIVSKFLIKYLLVWDGYEHSKKIHSLIEWLTFGTIQEFDVLASVLRVIFRSCDTDDACMLLSSLTIMLRHLVTGSMCRRADLPPPLCDDPPDGLVFTQLYMAVGKLIGEMLVERVSFEKRTSEANLIAHALYFYQEVISMETEGDVCAFMMIPSTLVYHVLFSGHRSNIHHLSMILVSYDSVCKERLYRLGVFDEYETQLVSFLGTYLMDVYRALFTTLDFRADLQPGVFTKEFIERTTALEPLEAFSFQSKSNVTWWSSSVGSAPFYPSLVTIKEFIETKLAQLP